MKKLNNNDYKNIYYINSNGDDSNNGSKIKPCKTIKGLVDKIELNTDTLIFLSEGEFEIDETIFNKGSNCTLSICGDNFNTTLIQVKGFFSNSGGGSSTFTCNFYNLIYTAPKVTDFNANYLYSPYNFINVVFKDIADNSYSFFCSQNKIEFYNCTKVEQSDNFLRTTGGEIKLYNCYGAFSSGYGTIQSKWDIENNLITEKPLLNSKYVIKSGGNKVGVYSGENSWFRYQFLLKNNNNYYTMNDKFYDHEHLNFKSCDKNIKNTFSSMEELLEEKTKSILTPSIIEIDKGTLFQFDLNNNLSDIKISFEPKNE